MMELVDAAWVAPVFSKHPEITEQQKKEDWLAFAEFCGDALQVRPGVHPADSWSALYDTLDGGQCKGGRARVWPSPFGHGGHEAAERGQPSRSSVIGHDGIGCSPTGTEYPLPELCGVRLRQKMAKMVGKSIGPDG